MFAQSFQTAGLGGLSGTELLVVLGVAVLLFGGKKIPEVAKGLGEGIKNFKQAMKDNEEPSCRNQEAGLSFNTPPASPAATASRVGKGFKQKPRKRRDGICGVFCLRRSTAQAFFTFGGTIASFAAFATRNLTTFLAGILIASPVAGLRPIGPSDPHERACRCPAARRPRSS